MKFIKNHIPAVLTVIVALILWSELGGLYGKGRRFVLSKIKKSAA